MTRTLALVSALALVCMATAQSVSPSRDPCQNFACQNGGTCSAPDDSPTCLCAAGFFGANCEYNTDPCYNNFGCLNGGNCTAPADAPYCVCPDGFTGEKCESQIGGQCPAVVPNSFGTCGGIFCSNDTECAAWEKCCPSSCGQNLCTNLTVSRSRDPCQNFVCQNGGTCNAPDDSPTCLCAVGFFGANCEYNRDPCYNNFGCLNSGKCTAPADAPFCVCPDGFTGEKCESQIGGQCPAVAPNSFGTCGGILCSNDTECAAWEKCCPSSCGHDLCTNLTVSPSRDPCQNFICQNGGTCNAPDDSPTCLCAVGFLGANCEYNTNPCYNNFGCLNGGNCTAPADAPYCVCPGGFTGEKCESQIGGQCPAVVPNSFGTCGGIFCSLDTECAAWEKCCPSSCGQNLCTNLTVSPSRDPCQDFVCQNGGTCNAPDDAPTCLCAAGFFGANCEYNTDPCYKNFGCLNGGNCTAPADAPFCVCPGGFTGEKCESQIGGQCPAVVPNSFGTCGGIFCISDTECAAWEKCCPSSCGHNLCTNLTESAKGEPVCSEGCPEGYTCEYKPFPCKEDTACIDIVVPTCVQPVDQCGGCPEGAKCVSIVCITEPCPAYECVPETAPPKDNCGGCPEGQVCQPSGIVCVRAPCPEAFECVAVSTPRPTPAAAACNLACRRGYECQLRAPACRFWSRWFCSSRPIPTCVPKCPRTNGSRRRCSRWWKPKKACSDDNDCRKNKNQRCCPSQCEWDVCTNVRNKN